MQYDDIIERQDRRPFEPFRIKMSSGNAYDCRHPELILVTKRRVILGYTIDPNDRAADRTVDIDPLHVTSIEDLPITPRRNDNGSD